MSTIATTSSPSTSPTALETAPALGERISDAITQFERDGYCVFPALIPGAEADALAQRCLSLHEDPANRRFITGTRPYESLFCMLNLEERVWPCAAHPAALGIARHALGAGARVGEACSKPTWPDPGFALGLHVDSSQFFHRIPDVPWLVNSMWMLTDFTAENGATGVVPGSQRTLAHRSFPRGEGHPQLIPITAPRGSLVMWHSNLIHTVRPNCSGQVRVGLNIVYYPPWFNLYSEASHQPVWPETWERMPEVMRQLIAQRRGGSRAEVYERP